MRLTTVIISITFLLSCTRDEASKKANARPPDLTRSTKGGVKLSISKKSDAEAVKNTDPVIIDYTGYYLPWPKFPIHPSVVKNRSTAIPNLHYGTFYIHAVDHKTKTISFSNLAFGMRTEYSASFKMSFQTAGDGKKIPVIAAQTKQFSFQVSESGIFFWGADGGMKRMDKLNPFKYNPAVQTEHSFVSDRDITKLSDGDLPNGSIKTLKKKDLKNLTITDLRIMRKSIYARHGAAFEEYEMALFFSRNSWYVPFFTLREVQKKLTATEIKNIELIFSTERKKRR